MKNKTRLSTVLLGAAFVLLLVACYLTYDTRKAVKELQKADNDLGTTPVFLPLSFLKKEPECARKLMDEINVRQVRMLQGQLDESDELGDG